MANQKLSKESEPREGKSEKKTAKGLTEATETEHALFAKEQNRGTRDTQKKLHYKRRGRVVKKIARKKRKKHKKEEIL